MYDIFTYGSHRYTYGTYVYIYIYVFKYTYIYICFMIICGSLYMFICVYIYTFIFKYIYIYTYIYMYISTYIMVVGPPRPFFFSNGFLRFGHFQDPSGAPSRAAGEPQGLSEAHDGVWCGQANGTRGAVCPVKNAGDGWLPMLSYWGNINRSCEVVVKLKE